MKTAKTPFLIGACIVLLLPLGTGLIGGLDQAYQLKLNSDSPSIQELGELNDPFIYTLNGPVYAIAVDGDDIYVGGDFTEASGVQVNHIAKWDGMSWSALGSGVNGPVYAILVTGSNVFVGGAFSRAGDSYWEINNVAFWQGDGWLSLSQIDAPFQWENGVMGPVYALAVSDGYVYVGGDFDYLGCPSVYAYNIARWKNENWAAVGFVGPGGSGSGVNGPVYALAVQGEDLFIGGNFSLAGAIENAPANSIAKYDGSFWQALGEGVDGPVRAIAASETAIYVGGEFQNAGGFPAPFIARWMGSAWTSVGGGTNGPVYSLAVKDEDVYAGGGFTQAGASLAVRNFARWNGRAWVGFGLGTSDPVYDIGFRGNDIIVGGAFIIAGSVPATYAAKWFDKFWTAIESPMPKFDLVGTWAGQGTYVRNTDTGSWLLLGSEATMIAVGDVIGCDGLEDLVGIWPGQSRPWIYNLVTGAWISIAIPSGTLRHIATGDMDGNGCDELILAYDENGVCYAPDSGGYWVKIASPAEKIATGDLDGDGIDDLIGIWPLQGGVWVKYSSTGRWERIASTAIDIDAGDMNGDGREDLVGTWNQQGVFYRDSVTRVWWKMATQANRVACGDLDGDGVRDLLGVWPGQGGVWVKYSSDGTWEPLSSTVRELRAGKFRMPEEHPSSALLSSEEPIQPMGGDFGGGFDRSKRLGESPIKKKYQEQGKGHIVYEHKGLVPVEDALYILSRIPGPGEPGFVWIEQADLYPQERFREGKKADRDPRSGRKESKKMP